MTGDDLALGTQHVGDGLEGLQVGELWVNMILKIKTGLAP